MTAPHADPAVRRAQRVLAMVHELHKQGYQRIRIMPGMSSSGADWRCSITHVGNIAPKDGAKIVDWQLDCAHYTSGQDNSYFFGKMPRQTRRAIWPPSSWTDSRPSRALVGALTGRTSAGTAGCSASPKRVHCRSLTPTTPAMART